MRNYVKPKQAKDSLMGSPMGKKRVLTVNVKPIESMRNSQNRETRNRPTVRLLDSSFSSTTGNERSDRFQGLKKASQNISRTTAGNIGNMGFALNLSDEHTASKGHMIQVAECKNSVDKRTASVGNKNSEQKKQNIQVIQVAEYKKSIHQVLVLPKVSIDQSILTSLTTQIQQKKSSQNDWIPNESRSRKLTNKSYTLKGNDKGVRTLGMVTQTKDSLRSMIMPDRYKSGLTQRTSNGNRSKISLSKAVDFRHDSRDQWTLSRDRRTCSPVEVVDKWSRYSRYLSNPH